MAPEGHSRSRQLVASKHEERHCGRDRRYQCRPCNSGCRVSRSNPPTHSVAIHQRRNDFHHQHKDFILYPSKEDVGTSQRLPQACSSASTGNTPSQCDKRVRNRQPPVISASKNHDVRTMKTSIIIEHKKSNEIKQPPKSPRPQRLPTPDISDIDEDQWWGTSNSNSKILSQDPHAAAERAYCKASKSRHGEIWYTL